MFFKFWERLLYIQRFLWYNALWKIFKFGFSELFVFDSPALFALSPLRGAPPEGEP